jgi:hypothetical protein
MIKYKDGSIKFKYNDELFKCAVIVNNNNNNTMTLNIFDCTKSNNVDTTVSVEFNRNVNDDLWTIAIKDANHTTTDKIELTFEQFRMISKTYDRLIAKSEIQNVIDREDTEGNENDINNENDIETNNVVEDIDDILSNNEENKYQGLISYLKQCDIDRDIDINIVLDMLIVSMEDASCKNVIANYRMIMDKLLTDILEEIQMVKKRRSRD